MSNGTERELNNIGNRIPVATVGKRKIEERLIAPDYDGKPFPEKSVALCIVDIDNTI